MKLNFLLRAPLFASALFACAGLDAAAQRRALPAASLPPLVGGVSVRIYQIDEAMSHVVWPTPGQTPNVSFITPLLDLEDEAFGAADQFITVVDGYIRAPSTGRYGFRLISDDGSQLRIGGQLVVNHDGLHGPEPLDGELELEEGWHPMEAVHFEGWGGARLSLAWRPPGATAFELIPTTHLGAHAAEVRVTSPGKKAVLRPLPKGRPGDGQWLAGVHPSYRLEKARPEGFEPKVGGIDWLADGTLVLCTWDPDGAVYFLEGVGKVAPDRIRVRRFASGLAEPLGLCVVNDRIFVLQKQELTELIDTDLDGVADEYRAVASGWQVTANFHEFAFGLVHRAGRFYANLAIAIDPGGASTKPQLPDRGSVIEIDAQTGDWRIVARGLRTPNGIGLGDDGQIYLTDNQGDWVPVSKLLVFAEGAFFGNRSVVTGTPLEAEFANRAETPPVVWLPQGEIGNSPGEVTPLRHGLYKGQLVHTDVTHGGLKRTAMEIVDGVRQGTVFRFTQGLEGGANRVKNGPDGALYVGGIGSSGNWGQEGKQSFGLERLVFTAEPCFEPLSVRSFANGLAFEFTEPLAEGAGWEADDYVVTRWRYEPTALYGGPKVDETFLPTRSASVSPDRRRVFIEVDGLQAGTVVHVRLPLGLRSEADRALWTAESWTTLNRLPTRVGPVLPNPFERPMNGLNPSAVEQGWELLFDGADPARHWKSAGGDDFPAGWVVDQGALHRAGPGGDITTRELFGDFELELEWKVESGGNSGIFWRVGADERSVWTTGPEMQVLDNLRHPDGRDPKTSAGSLYALYAPPIDATRPAGAWNRVRIRVQGQHVELWLNGQQTVDCEIGSEDWNRRIEASKFASLKRFGRLAEGRIALQDHGDPVWFRGIKVRRL